MSQSIKSKEGSLIIEKYCKSGVNMSELFYNAREKPTILENMKELEIFKSE